MTAEQAAESVEPRPETSIGAFVAEHNERLLGLAWLICRDRSDAADAVQAGLEQAWRKRSTLRDDARLRPWLDRIVVREAIRVGKRKRSWLDRMLTLAPDIRKIESDERASTPPTYAMLRAAFDALSPEQRAVVALHLHLGYSVAETASLVGAPEETVRSRLRLARARLRRELEETSA